MPAAEQADLQRQLRGVGGKLRGKGSLFTITGGQGRDRESSLGAEEKVGKAQMEKPVHLCQGSGVSPASTAWGAPSWDGEPVTVTIAPLTQCTRPPNRTFCSDGNVLFTLSSEVAMSHLWLPST